MNKKGAEGISFQLVLVIISILVLLGVGLFLGGFFDSANKLARGASNNVEVIAGACEIAAQQGLVNAFCYQPRPVSDNDWVTCPSGILRFGFDKETLEGTNTVVVKREFENLPACNNAIRATELKRYIDQYDIDRDALVDGEKAHTFTGVIVADTEEGEEETPTDS